MCLTYACSCRFFWSASIRAWASASSLRNFKYILIFARLFDFGILFTSRHRRRAIWKMRRAAFCARIWSGLCPVSWNHCFAFISSDRIAYPIRRFNRHFFPLPVKENRLHEKNCPKWLVHFLCAYLYICACFWRILKALQVKKSFSGPVSSFLIVKKNKKKKNHLLM